ncbi:MAG: hypothetical protein ACUVQH_10135 [Thermogutta sp.]
MKRSAFLIAMATWGVVCAGLSQYGWAQPPWANGGGPPGVFGGGPPGMFVGPPGMVSVSPAAPQASITGNPEIDRRVQFYEGLMRQMDTNQDGTVSKEEIGQSRMGEYIVSRMKERAGVDVSGGFRIDEMRQKVIDYYKQRYSGDSSQGGQPSSGTQPQSTVSPTPQSGSILRFGPNVTVPGFGSPASSTQTTPSVPGFGTPGVTSGGVSGATTSPSGSSPQVQVQPLPPPQPLDERIRRYAEGLMRHYDENRSGKLEKNEWEKMRGSDWAKADKDGNSELTLQEIAEHLTAQAGGSSSSSSSSGAATPVSTRRFIQRAAWDRLPSGLPSWFKEKDRDRDGQVLMAEFTDKWTEDKLREFQKHDLNGDGIITPAECLKASGRH